jgi:hypothetical protein
VRLKVANVLPFAVVLYLEEEACGEKDKGEERRKNRVAASKKCWTLQKCIIGSD